ncbi:MAG: hypothetical protein M1825_005343 [Sarcosagium campestre]|nr:MAG: hypothetical protein M1825_005343 [Sarcosagium campestre]
MPQDIPGFYYDESKKKYFKILPHHAAPAGAAYSSSTVRQTRRMKAQQIQNERLRAPHLGNSTPRVQRAALLTETPGILAGREVGLDSFTHAGVRAGVVAKMHVKGWTRQEVLNPVERITAMAWDGLTGAVITGD